MWYNKMDFKSKCSVIKNFKMQFDIFKKVKTNKY